MVMLKVYMDESGIHAGASVIAVSAYIAKPATWRGWAKKWNVAEQPIGVFHATDCANSRGEFKGWTKQQCDDFVAKFLPILPAHKIAGLVIAIQMDDFRSALKGQEELWKMIGDPYICCFQWSVLTIIEFASTYGKEQRIKFIHEVNDCKGETQKTFEYVKQFHNPKGISLSIAFGTKSENTPLQAADILAYEGGKFLREKADAGRRAWKALDPGYTRIITHRYGKENMAALISELKTFRENVVTSGSHLQPG
jgi:hypothetical protein